LRHNFCVKTVEKRQKKRLKARKLSQTGGVLIEKYFQVLAGEFKADMAFKCHLCKKVYMNNIEIMKHLSLHVESDRASAVDLVSDRLTYENEARRLAPVIQDGAKTKTSRKPTNVTQTLSAGQFK